MHCSPTAAAMTVTASAYLDPSGRPRLIKSVAGFIDMLGFSTMSAADKDEHESQRLLAKIVAAIDDSRRFVRESMTDYDPLIPPTNLAVKYFSDNLVLGYPMEVGGVEPASAINFVLRCVQRYQLRMSLDGFFIRGALTQGLICLTEDIIFGPAIVESYHLESTTAIVPRILLTEPLRQLLEQNHTPAREPMPPSPEDLASGDLVCRDVDGWWFVNYLDAARDARGVNWDYVARHKESILASLALTTRHDVLPKFGWACRYHNVFCHWNRSQPGYSDRYRIDRVDEQSTIHRLGDLSAPGGTP
jgi:hypothetical protein